MKKLLVVLLMFMMTFALAACGGGEGEEGSSGSGDGGVETMDLGFVEADWASVTGETVTQGKIQFLVPDGWYNDVESSPVDMFRVSSATKAEIDELGTIDAFPFVEAMVFTNRTEIDYSFYLGAQEGNDLYEIVPFTLNGKEWSGITYLASGLTNKPVVRLFTLDDAGVMIELTIEPNTSDESINVNDPEVQAILASVVGMAE